jgi:hypothetical protein
MGSQRGRSEGAESEGGNKRGGGMKLYRTGGFGGSAIK